MKPEMRARNVKMVVVKIRNLKTPHDRPWRKAKAHKWASGQGRQTAWRLFEIILIRSKLGVRGVYLASIVVEARAEN